MSRSQAVQTAQVGAAPFFAGKNKIINGDFAINQRGFSSTTTNGAYTFDRWQALYSGGTVTYTPQTFTLGTAPVAGYESKNFIQVAVASQSGTADYAALGQKIEDVRTFANQTVTVSFWAKASSGTPKISIELGQSFGSGGSPSAQVNTNFGSATLSTSWARYTFTASLPSIAGKTLGTTAGTDYLILWMWLSAGSDYNARTGSMGLQNSTFQIWGVQVEAGTVATAFQTATGTLQGELAACQRYYYRMTSAENAYTRFGTFSPAGSTTQCLLVFPHPVVMRVKPTALEYGGTYALSDSSGTASISSMSLFQGSSPNESILDITCSGATQYRPYIFIANNSTSTYIGVTAEL